MRMGAGGGALVGILIGLVIIVLIVIAPRVPGIWEAGGIAPDFGASIYLELASLILTIAIISPLTAQFVRWRENRTWRSARQIAFARLRASLDDFAQSYGKLLVSWSEVSADPDAPGLPPRPRFDRFLGSSSLMQTCLDELCEFQAILRDESVVFDANMHVHSTGLRRQTDRFRVHLEALVRLSSRAEPVKISLGRFELDALRALMDKPRLPELDAETLPDRPDQSGGLDLAWYLARSTPASMGDRMRIGGSINFGVTVDTRDQSIAQNVGQFEGIDWAELRQIWRDFAADFPLERGAQVELSDLGAFNAPEAQRGPVCNWVRYFIPEVPLQALLFAEAEPDPTDMFKDFMARPEDETGSA